MNPHIVQPTEKFLAPQKVNQGKQTIRVKRRPGELIFHSYLRLKIRGQRKGKGGKNSTERTREFG